MVVHLVASLVLMMCGVLLKMPKSKIRMRATIIKKDIQTIINCYLELQIYFLTSIKFLDRLILIVRHKKSAMIDNGTFMSKYNLNYKTDLTVVIILAAILYGSPFEAGLLSSNQPFHPF